MGQGWSVTSGKVPGEGWKATALSQEGAPEICSGIPESPSRV